MTAERRAAIHLIAQAVLAALLAAVSYMAPPWSGAYAEVFLGVRSRLMAGELPAGLLLLATPAILLLMVVNLAVAIPVIGRSTLASSRRLLIGGSLLLAVIGALAFPGASHDLELYHAHARMAAHGINPYTTTPREAFGDDLSETMPWPDQHAPYGPLSIGLHALLIGRLGDPWTAALILKALYALLSVLFVWIIVRMPAVDPPGRAAAAVTVGWGPLLLLEFAGNGHTDGLMDALCALALIAWLSRRRLLPWLLLGLAALVKVEALLFLPILVAADIHRGSRPGRTAGQAAIAVAIVLAGYLFFGGPQNALPGLREESAKVMRSVPQLVAYVSGIPDARAAWGLRILFIAVYAEITWSVARGRSILWAAPVLYGIYLFLAKSFLQPWHGALLVYLLAVGPFVGRRDRLVERTVDVWTVSSVLGGYSFLVATRNLSSAGQAASTVIMVLPVGIVLLGGFVMGAMRRRRAPAGV